MIDLFWIRAMHEKFGISNEEVPDFTNEERLFRIAAMLEELSEFTSAKTKEDELDALVDLVVFALGTAERMGFLDVFEEAYMRVMQSNMTKTLGANNKRGGFQIDLVKGEGFKPATIKDLVEEK
jgi:predicted HAD superfamily Cof-like phosphohydrolase